MEMFIYVFSTEDRDKLLERGVTLLKSDTVSNVYVFANERRETFSLNDVEFVLTNTLTF